MRSMPVGPRRSSARQRPRAMRKMKGGMCAKTAHESRIRERDWAWPPCVDDEAIVRRLVHEVLRMNGYTVLEAIQGDDALRLCEEHPGGIDLLLTDVMMPGMSGRELAERAAVLRPETRVLFMSGYTDDAVLRHGVFDADIAFIQKPFKPAV